VALLKASGHGGLDEYQMALRLWSEVRGLYLPETAEVLEAPKILIGVRDEIALLGR
jgi:hypothetical protein